MSLKGLVNAIAARADKKGTTWVSQATLADDIGASERHVRALLRRLERLGIITRTARSSGRSGRLTDIITLAMHRSFDFTAGAIRTELAKVATGTPVPPAAKSSNRNKSTRATGTRVPGSTKGITYPIQERERPTYQEKALAPGAPRLQVVGGRSLEDGQ